MLPPSSEISIMLREPSFEAFSTLGGTSLALPYPQPTFPLPLPTTTMAAKLKRRPPLTTAAQRLILITLSVNSPRFDSAATTCSSLNDRAHARSFGHTRPRNPSPHLAKGLGGMDHR